MTTAEATWSALEPPWQRALELAWESCRAGSLGVGAVVTDPDGSIVATGRNRLFEPDPGDDHLGGTPIAHAETNALAKLRWGLDHSGHTVWTTLEPCLLCAGGIRLAGVGAVRFLAADPLCDGLDGIPRLSPWAAAGWPTVKGPGSGQLSAFASVLHLHAFAFWLPAEAMPEPYERALAAQVGLARDLAEAQELIALAADGATTTDVLGALWSRLG
jgi:tRNA(Arg) A34 adenosine deaminase TadA